mmetsp:Transcript_7892/g.18462  ORF Transcript_7892/g.18462 Transcript_7892/m.18462 type:complete len:849 (+) Transcript_7892:96-2642(+)
MPLEKSGQRRALLIACGFTLLAQHAVSAHEAKGSCECLTVEDLRHETSADAGEACALAARPRVVSVADTAQCYRRDYGLGGCRAWDAEEQPVCAGPDGLPKPGRPSWCSASWCYVNVSTCSVSSSPSVFLSAELGLSYSYGTCGSIDRFQGWLAAEVVRGRTLRAHLLSTPEDYLTQTYREVQARAGLKLDVMPLQLPSSGDDWQRCLDEVATGLLDLCIGGFWVTLGRIRNVSFVTHTSIEVFDVVKLARTTKDKLSGDSSATSLRPFTTRLWVVVMSITVVVVGIIFMFEQQDAVVAASCTKAQESGRRVQGSLWSTGESMQLGYSYGQCWSLPKSSMGRAVASLLAVFWVVTLAGYIASWAAALQGNSHKEDWSQLLSEGRRTLCVPSPLVADVAGDGQVPLSTIVPMSLNEGTDFDLDTVACDAALVPSSSVWHHHEVVLPRFAQAATSQPTSYVFAQAISYWLGEVEVLRSARTHPSLRVSAAAMEQDYKPLDVVDFTGMYLLLGCAWFLLLLYRLIWTCVERRPAAPQTPTCCLDSSIKTSAKPEKSPHQHWDVPELVTLYSDVEAACELVTYSDVEATCEHQRVSSPGPIQQMDATEEALLLKSLAENSSSPDVHEVPGGPEGNSQRLKKRRANSSNDVQSPVLKRATPVQKTSDNTAAIVDPDICQEMPLVLDVGSKKAVQAKPATTAGVTPSNAGGVRQPKGSKRGSNRPPKASRRDQAHSELRHHRDLVLRLPSDRLEPSSYAAYPRQKSQDTWQFMGEDDRYISSLSRGSGSSEIDNEALRKCRECGDKGNGRQRCGGDSENLKFCLGSLAPSTVDQFEIRLNGHFQADANIFATSL